MEADLMERLNLGVPELVILAAMFLGACTAAVVVAVVLVRRRPPRGDWEDDGPD